MTKAVEGCTKLPPPKLTKSPRPTNKNPEGCPKGLICYTEKEFEIITDSLSYLKKIVGWANNTWDKCGEEP